MVKSKPVVDSPLSAKQVERLGAYLYLHEQALTYEAIMYILEGVRIEYEGAVGLGSVVAETRAALGDSVAFRIPKNGK
jgi:hypothetical protein